jgi:protein-S-isoprenylcysteine O-methyltransferase Ste14
VTAPPQATTPAVRSSPVLEAVFRHRGALLALVAAPISAAALSSSPLQAWEGVLGGGLLAGGALLRILSVRRIGKRARVRTSGAARLLCEGPFARVRNPLYVANLEIAAGACVLSGLEAWTLAAVLYVLLVYHFVVRGEEVTLRDLFGERYDRYLERVPRWLPRLRAAEPIESSPAPLWPWRDVLGREGPTMLLGVSLAFAALVYLRVHGPGVSELLGLLERLAAVFHAPLWGLAAGIAILAALGEGLATHLKRRRHERARAALAK